MKKLYFAIALLFVTAVSAGRLGAQFDRYFHDRTLRMDYVHAGDASGEQFYFEELLDEPYWGGSKVNLVDTTFYGNYYLNVYDAATDSLIYSRGYSTLFWEWMATAEAMESNFAAGETVVMPYPRNDVRVEICSRDSSGRFVPVFERQLDVDSPFIRKERRSVYPVCDIHYSGNPAGKIDIVLLPEGYTAEEMDRFRKDCEEFAEGLFTFSPYAENSGKFNIRAVLAPSPESGTDMPVENTWKRTLLNSSFYTFGSERYVMSFDNRAIRDVASNAPYDFIYILVNSKKYGGGAIYNHYGISVAGNALKAKIYVHEFCHLFLGLGDEYVGTTSYDDMYNVRIEPWEANLTSLVDFESKWKDMLDENTPVPTPADRRHEGKLGVYEGGGYVAKGIYRPRMDCLMNTFKGDTFCPVCIRAILKQIEFYTE